MDALTEFSVLADRLDNIVSSPSVAGRPAGSSDAGTVFEDAIENIWEDFARLHQPFVKLVRITHPIPSRKNVPILCLRNLENHAEIFFPERRINLTPDSIETDEIPDSWLLREFTVSELIRNHLGEGPYNFAPPTPRDSIAYYGENYPHLFRGKKTKFDWAMALSLNGVLVEKMLFEYKSAKSSGGETVDGNAHERLAFQALQYLEVASQMTSCSLNVVMSSAFAKYRNKYHPSFNQQSIRLGDAFRWFKMRLFMCHSEYTALFSMLSAFLIEGTRPVTDYRSIWESTP